ncbi:phenolic glucoside malonyltransferase 2 [Cucumis melo var. makuwa]|uniref:Phenolic glucoside malonyltransferase 2 n=2 Tax=Cucumis melo TaxID=3656 RepID=A0A5A7SJ03_CUCMM|nr:phenolic glucoside malonyltransferase 2 [Cucumis melo var. makuwa]TYK11627.1 phenolic glucoside malonyltransferase 2 [Cucumis melo var. makuwa]
MFCQTSNTHFLSYSRSLTTFRLLATLFGPNSPTSLSSSFSKGDTVSLTVAESSDLDFLYLTGGGFRLEANYHRLVPTLSMAGDRVSARALQLTIFPNEGFSIGITTHHVVVGGNSSTSFVKSWA